MKSAIAIAVTMVILGAFNSRGRASLIEIAITAEVLYADDAGNLLEGNIHIGDMIYGRYMYDSDTQAFTPYQPNEALYRHYAPPYGIFLTIGELEIYTDAENVDFVIGIEDGNRPSDFDYYSVCSRYNVSNNEVPMDSIVWQLADYSGQALSNICLPTTAPVIDDWQDVNLLTLSGGGNPQEGEYGFCIIASVRSAALIPEPATLMLLSLGCLRLGRKRRFVLPDVGGH